MIVYIWLTLLTLFAGFYVYIMRQHILRYIHWKATVDNQIVALLRSLNGEQRRVYIAQFCQICGQPLKSGTARQHDGRYLCSNCKAKSAS